MKKKLVLSSILILLLTGCGDNNTITCRNSFNEELDDQNLSYDVEIDIKVDEKKVSGATAEMSFDSEKNATSMCSVMKLVETDVVKVSCNGKKVTISNYHKLDNDEKSKDELIKELEEDGFKCK